MATRTKKKIEIQIVSTIVEFLTADLHPDTRTFLKNRTPVYEDRVVEEDLYRIDDIMDDIELEVIQKPNALVMEDLKAIEKAMGSKHAYFRIVAG